MIHISDNKLCNPIYECEEEITQSMAQTKWLFYTVLLDIEEHYF